jgi:hypothetical protein
MDIIPSSVQRHDATLSAGWCWCAQGIYKMSSNALFLQGRTSITRPRILPRTGLFGKLERLNSACSSAKRADAVRISHTLHTHHPSLDLAYLPILVFNKACIPPCCPLHHLHAHSLSFSSVPIVAIRHNCRSLHHRELVQAQSQRRLPVLITVPLRHNKLVFLPLCTFLPTKPLIFTLQRQHSPSQKKLTFISAGR